MAGTKHTDGLKGSDPVSFERSRKLNYRDFPGSPVVKINAGGMGLLPDQGTKIPHAAQRTQKKKKNTKHQRTKLYHKQATPKLFTQLAKGGGKKWGNQNLVENSHFDRCQQTLELLG